MKVLVSICNKNRALAARLADVFLFEVETDSGALRPIVLAHPRLQRAKGITGLAHYGDGILAVLQGAGQVVLLSRTYEVKAVWTLPLLKHGHSIAVAGQTTFIASTGTDSIVEFDPGTGASRVYWRHNGHDEDTIHINSLVNGGNDLYATAFGPKSSSLWNSASGGYLAGLKSGRRIADSLYHPHSACLVGDEFYFCESSRMTVGRANGQRLAVNIGYPRGLIVANDRIYVGISKGRTESVSTGLKVPNPAVPRLKASRCAILTYRRDRENLAQCELLDQVCLQDYGDEIYDLLPV